MKITAKTRLSEILKQNPDAAEILFKAGLSCIGCPMTMQETLEEGCKAHGMSKKEIDDLIKKLNTKEKTK
jgi:hybrid cluster-associated redox disulfide protein